MSDLFQAGVPDDYAEAVERVESTTFPFPTRQDIGDFTSGQLLRDAARLSTRAAAGPFRSFGRIAAEPRPYQLVPLMMALKLDPVRLLIADDVGIGKTIEAALIARELLDSGEVRRVAVLCPPHLAEQWQRELEQKFHIEAELVLSSTIQKLERDLPVGVSVFDRHRFTIVSTDFIKSQRRADDFVVKCPEFVIVDEVHGCTLSGGVGRGRQQRFELLRRIAQDKSRHLMLVTATPHSGNEDAFRSLLSLLDEELRCVSSSPAAAAATLRSRAAADEAADDEVDEIGRRTVLDQDDTDDVVALDFSPGSDNEDSAESTRRKLLEFARRAEALGRDADHKLQGAIREIKLLLKDGFQPVVFCRFVDTADYFARHLREVLSAKVRVESLVADQGEYVLVCTDCLASIGTIRVSFGRPFCMKSRTHSGAPGAGATMIASGRRSRAPSGVRRSMYAAVCAENAEVGKHHSGVSHE